MPRPIRGVVFGAVIALLLGGGTATLGGELTALAEGDETQREPILVPSDWALRPSEVPVGGEFRLLFVTNSMRDATSADIADYDAFVQAEANSQDTHADIQQHSERFRVIGSTSVVAARDHIGAAPEDGPGVPIYWLNGKRIARTYQQFFSGQWDAYSATQPSGDKFSKLARTHLRIATGTVTDGTIAPRRMLGTTHTVGGKRRVAYAKVGRGDVMSYDSALADDLRRFYAISPVFRVVDPGTPYVTSVGIVSDAGDDRDYATGETVRAQAVFDQHVSVTGRPALKLRFGRDLVTAYYVAAESTSTELVFEHTVAGSDRDNDGVSIPSSALRLNGGSITNESGTVEVVLYNSLLTDRSNHRVNRVPFIVNLSILSRPRASADEYGVGETIEAAATFSEPVDVDMDGGDPYLRLQVGNGKPRAAYVRTEGQSLVFRYVVANGDLDVNGIEIKSNQLSLNGGTIRSVETGRDARVRHEQAEFREHMVDSGLTPPASTDASLAGLRLSGVSLRPSFIPDVTDYLGTAPHSVDATTITATPRMAGAQVTYSPADADTNAPGQQAALAVGTTSLTVSVSAEDGETTRTYTISVVRQASGTLPVVSIAPAVASVTEGAPAQFTLTRDGPTSGSLTVSIQVSQTGSVISTGGGYQAPTTVTFQVGDATATLSVDTESDTTDEADGAIAVALLPGSSYTVGDPVAARVAVVDDDDIPTVALHLDPASISENGGASSVTATLDHASSEPTSILVTATAQEPATDADFTLSGQELTIPAGETTSEGDVTIRAVNNAANAPDKSANVTASATNPLGITAPAAVTLTIADDDVGADVPTGLQVASGDAQATLSWDAPASDADIIRHEYRYRVGDDQYSDTDTWTSIDNSAPGGEGQAGAEVTGLTNGQRHTFQVRAVNDDGASEPTAEVTVLVGAGLGICDRTAPIRTGILALIENVSDCADVTTNHLSSITGTLELRRLRISRLEPGDFSGLSSLTDLQLAGGTLESLSDGAFEDLSALTTLDITYNRIRTISTEAFRGLTALERLSLGYNSLLTLNDPVFSDLSALTELELQSSRITTFSSETFSDLGQLIRLDLSYNEIVALPADGFSDLSSLEFLRLSGNDMFILGPEMFRGLDSLRELWLDSAQLVEASFHLPFQDLDTLRTLALEFGLIKHTLPRHLLKGLTSLDSLMVMGNYYESNVLKLPLRLVVDQEGKLYVKAVTGAPFEIIAEIEVANGALEGGITTLTVPTGSTQSEPVAFSRTPGTTGAVTARFKRRPSLPTDPYNSEVPKHSGYSFDLGPGARNRPLELMPGLPRVTLDLSSSSLLELDDSLTTGVNEAQAIVTARVAEPVQTPFTVEVSVEPAGSASDADLELSENTTLSFAANATSSTGTVTITAVNNEDASADREYAVRGVVDPAVAQNPRGLGLTILDDEPPAAPSGFAATAGYGEATLTWDAPARDAGIDGYEFRHKLASATDYPIVWTAIGDSQLGGAHDDSLTVGGLTNGVTYNFQLRAVNKAGVTGAAATSEPVTPRDRPRVRLILTPDAISEQDDPATTSADESVATVSASLSYAVNTAFSVTVMATDSQAYAFGEERTLHFAANSTTSTGVVAMTALDNTAGGADTQIAVSGSVSAPGTAAGVREPEAVTLTILDDDNDPPTARNMTVRTDEDTTYTFKVSDFGFSDPDPGDRLASVGLLGLPQKGKLTLSNVTLRDGYKIDASDIPNLTFAPEAHGFGQNYATFRFTVSDGAASSIDLSMMTIAVTEVNDPPAFVGDAALTVVEGLLVAGAVVAEDPDRGESVQYSITGGADGGAFTVGAATGELTFKTAPDFDSPADTASTDPLNAAGNNEYVVEVTASSGAGARAATAVRTLVVSVTGLIATTGGDRTVTSVTITSAPGTAGAYGIDDVITVAVNFNGAVTVLPRPRLALGLSQTGSGGQATLTNAGSACYASGSGSASLLFHYAVQQGQQGQLTVQELVSNLDTDASAGAIYSGSRENPADLAFEATTASAAQAVDGVRPVLVSVGLSGDRTAIILEFSEALSEATADAADFDVTVDGAAATVSAVAASGQQVTLTLAAAVGAGSRVELFYREPVAIDRQPPSDSVCGLDFAGDGANAIQDSVGNDARGFDMVVERGSEPSLTAQFVDMPAQHDGHVSFSFRVRFSEPIATSYVWVRDTWFTVSGGEVESVFRVQKRSDLWNITVKPATREDITVTLPVPASCDDVLRNVCTKDGRGLSTEVSASVTGPGVDPDPLTAEFEDVPLEHDGASVFSFRMRFSEPIAISDVTLRDVSLSAVGGRVTDLHRVNGRSDLWHVEVTPNLYQRVTVRLTADAGCGGTNAVCTYDAKPLSNSPTVLVPSRAQPQLSVADTTAREGEGSVMTFRITLSHAAPVPVTVRYATENASATAGEDYTATSGTLTFAVGETAMTVSVAVHDDSESEGQNGIEGFKLRLGNATGALIEDGVGNGHIHDSN